MSIASTSFDYVSLKLHLQDACTLKHIPIYRNSCLLCVALTTTELPPWNSDKREKIKVLMVS